MKPESVLIFGGTSDLGSAMIHYLRHRGYNVAFTFCCSQKVASTLENSCAKHPGRCKGFHCDATDPTNIHHTWGQVSNAGFKPRKIVFFVGGRANGDQDPLSVVNLNLITAFWVLEECRGRLMNKANASIVIISSTAGIRGMPRSNMYCASKAALNQLVRNFALSFSPNLRVNAIAPGVINTKKKAGKRRVVTTASIPLGRFGTEAEVCKSIDFLLFTASYVTGQVMVVDGGLTL